MTNNYRTRPGHLSPDDLRQSNTESPGQSASDAPAAGTKRKTLRDRFNAFGTDIKNRIMEKL